MVVKIVGNVVIDYFNIFFYRIILILGIKGFFKLGEMIERGYDGFI